MLNGNSIHPESTPENIAIVGISCVYPKAADLKSFWNNIIYCIDAIGEPVANWGAKRYLDSGRISTPFGGFLKDLFQFDPREFGIMPSSVSGGEPDQFLALRVARDALLDAGYLRDDYDHIDTGVILGHSTYLHQGQGNHIQHHIILDQTIELAKALVPTLNDEKLEQLRSHLKSKLLPSNADVAPGLVPNVMTGRIANRLDLKGPNYIVDAACSSSLLAVSAAMDELRNGRSRMMIAGGVNASLPADVSVIFTQLGALSQRGKVRPFSTASDGTLLGEGLGMVVLKRQADAIADGDRIYAILRGIGQSSDGKGHGILAPSLDGEILAIQRAYLHSGVDPSTIGMIEAHGTGIPLGDKTEIAALKSVLGKRKSEQGSIALGSVKSMISHCIPAAGIAGLIKTALALHHKILPPTLCEEVNPELGIEQTPLYVNTAARPWVSDPSEPRRAGVNSFGFGGINTHAILEEAPTNAKTPENLSDWPTELMVFSSEDKPQLQNKLRQLLSIIETEEQTKHFTLSDLAASLQAQDDQQPYRLVILSINFVDLREKLQQALKNLEKPKKKWSTRSGILFSSQPIEGKLAFVFPGEGSQYIEMLQELALFFPEVRQWFDFWHGLYKEQMEDSRINIVFPPKSELTDERKANLEKKLYSMDVGSEAVFIGGQAINSLLQAYSIEPDAMLGHSSGESSALVASGALDNDNLAELADFIRKLNTIYQQVLAEGDIATGALLTVGGISEKLIEEYIHNTDEDIFMAMDNCANQKIIYSSPAIIEKLHKSLSAEGAICALLPFDRGYHTPHFLPMCKAFEQYYKDVGLKKSKLPLYSCCSASLFPQTTAAVRRLAAKQWSETVRFKETIEKMYQDGICYFVEVGPSGNLTSFMNDILAGKKDILTLTSNLRKKSSLQQILTLFGQLYVNQYPVNLSRLFNNRTFKTIDPFKGVEPPKKPMVLDNTMPILRFNAEDKNFINSLLPSSSSTQPQGSMSEQTQNLSPEPEHITKSTSESDTAVTTYSPSDGLYFGDSVMADYFNLMRNFLHTQESILSSTVLSSNDQTQTNASLSDISFPFLSTITEKTEYALKGTVDLSVFEDTFLQDHVLSGRISETDPMLLGLSCVPLMVSLEIMAEAVACLAGDDQIRTIENIKSSDWIALDHGEISLEVSTRLLDADNKRYSAAIHNQGNLAISAEFSFIADFKLNEFAALSQPIHPFKWPGKELYRIGMFHGPTFQSIESVKGWNSSGIDAELSTVSLNGFFESGNTPKFILNPVLLDALGQLAAYWIAQQVGADFNSFPSTIDRLELYSNCPQDINGLTLCARQTPMDPKHDEPSSPRFWQFECLNSKGEPLLRTQNLLNIFFPIPHRFYEVRVDPLHGRLGQLFSSENDFFIWQLPYFEDTFCSQSGGIFLRILAHATLSFDELEEWNSLSGNMHHKRQWLMGRICIKEICCYWYKQNCASHHSLYPSDVIVAHEDSGAPYVTGWWMHDLEVQPQFSLSHNRDSAYAIVSSEYTSVGIDHECYVPDKDYGFIDQVLNPQERSILGQLQGNDLDLALLKLWCAKEAAAKYFKTGFGGEPEKFVVSQADNELRHLTIQYSDMSVSVTVRVDAHTVIAVAI